MNNLSCPTVIHSGYGRGRISDPPLAPGRPVSARCESASLCGDVRGEEVLRTVIPTELVYPRRTSANALARHASSSLDFRPPRPGQVGPRAGAEKISSVAFWALSITRPERDPRPPVTPRPLRPSHNPATPPRVASGPPREEPPPGGLPPPVAPRPPGRRPPGRQVTGGSLRKVTSR